MLRLAEDVQLKVSNLVVRVEARRMMTLRLMITLPLRAVIPDPSASR